MYGRLPKQIQSTNGFQGCLASVDLNGEAADPLRTALVPSPLVSEGCDGETKDIMKQVPLHKDKLVSWVVRGKG